MADKSCCICKEEISGWKKTETNYFYFVLRIHQDWFTQKEMHLCSSCFLTCFGTRFFCSFDADELLKSKDVFRVVKECYFCDKSAYDIQDYVMINLKYYNSHKFYKRYYCKCCFDKQGIDYFLTL